MDRTYWFEVGTFLPGEKVVSQQSGVRLYDGEDRVRVTTPLNYCLWPNYGSPSVLVLRHSMQHTPQSLYVLCNVLCVLCVFCADDV